MVTSAVKKPKQGTKKNKVVEVPEENRWLELFSIFAHDLESPFVSVKYLLKQLETRKFDPEDSNHMKMVSSSRIAVERAESILYDLMTVTRAGKVGLPVEITNLVPTAIIHEAIELASGSALERDIKISFTNNGGDISVKADPALLKRTLDNLIYNAIRHTPSGEKVSVYTEPGKKCLFVHVKDSGKGLGDIQPQKLFEKFGQSELRISGKHRGVGLGLYFCRLAVTGMGGAILADDHPKGGAVFSIKLLKGEQV